MKHTKQTIIRDLSWLAFNARVLQEAKDTSNHIHDRLRFLGIFSNNLDEFFRVRVAALNKMVLLGKAAKMHLEANPDKILRKIQKTVITQQTAFDNIYAGIIKELGKDGIRIRNEKQLTLAQKKFITAYFDEKVRTEIIPLMIESIPHIPLLRDKSIYLACVLGDTNNPMSHRYALIEIPDRILPRFVILPSESGKKDIILLEDIIRHNLPNLFAPFGFNQFLGYIIKVTRDAELDLDNDVNTNIITEIEKGLKNRKRGRATRFIYDRSIDTRLRDYLIRRLSLSKKDNLHAGGRIHNFKDFMNFPASVFKDLEPRPRPFVHPLLKQPRRIMDVLEKRDVMLHFPYHSFDSIIDLLREAAIDPYVQSISITCYRLAKDSKLVNALINAVRNGKEVLVALELRARFDEEANIMWKARLEEEGVKVVLGLPGMKVHAKIGVIKKRMFNRTRQYGIISTGNFNENTARYYGDHCLLTTNKNIIADINHIFDFLQSPEPKTDSLKICKVLPMAPVNMRKYFLDRVAAEIKTASKKKKAFIKLKMNSLVDETLIAKLYEADLVVSGTEEAILMVECGADGVTEAEVLDALDIAHSEIKKLAATMKELAEKVGKPKVELEAVEIDPALISEIEGSHKQALVDAIATEGKLERYEAIDAVKDAVVAQYAPDSDDSDADIERSADVKAAFDSIEKDTIRKAIAVDKKRPDGRAQDEIRPIETEVDISPRVHGSALFTRGETQILSNVALGTTRMDMKVDNLSLEEKKTFWHHYNFPPFSVGETGFMRGPKRRDIGHGALAERALRPSIPSQEDFPYVTRVVSETLESNGSSSMGSVCASSMALQAAGVPVAGPVAGVAMGLIKEGDDYVVLTDIAGVEDHLGDMDFKVAGFEDGITALQMDIKITGVTFDILRDALEQARQGRLFILGKMAEAIDAPREQLSEFAPRIESIKIDPEKIGAVIGKGGETIRGMQEEFEADIDIEDDGTVRIYAPTGALVDACVAQIESMTKEAEIGDKFKGKVVKTTTFGAFVEIKKGTDGLLHISNVKPGERVGAVEDVLSSGDELDVTVVELDRERGRIGLRLSDDPAIEGKSPEELVAMGTGGSSGGGGGGRGGRERLDGGRGRGGDRGGRRR